MGGATTSGPDATHPQLPVKTPGGGAIWGGGSVEGVGGGGGSATGVGGVPKVGGLRATHYYHMHTSYGEVSGGLGVWRYVCDNSAFSSLSGRKS